MSEWKNGNIFIKSYADKIENILSLVNEALNEELVKLNALKTIVEITKEESTEE